MWRSTCIPPRDRCNTTYRLLQHLQIQWVIIGFLFHTQYRLAGIKILCFLAVLYVGHILENINVKNDDFCVIISIKIREFDELEQGQLSINSPLNGNCRFLKCHRDGSMTSTPSVTVDSFLKRFRIFKHYDNK